MRDLLIKLGIIKRVPTLNEELSDYLASLVDEQEDERVKFKGFWELHLERKQEQANNQISK